MTSNDLFSFLNNDNDSEISDSETALDAMQVDKVSSTELVQASTPSNKRPVTSPVPETRIDSPPLSPPLEDGPPAKRKRLDIASTSAPAVVVDEFETEAKREVAASAGLTGATETAGSRLELRYQVRLHWSFLELQADCQF
jgi:ATP-dependent RNA helicase DOB1